MVSGAHGMAVGRLADGLRDNAEAELRRIQGAFDPQELHRRATEFAVRLQSSLDQHTDDWKSEIPGKPVVGRLANRFSVPVARLRPLYIKEALDRDDGPFDEIKSVFASFADA